MNDTHVGLAERPSTAPHLSTVRPTRDRRSFKVFVSSTFVDLQEHRARVIEAIRSAGLFVDPMEDWTASANEPKDFSQERINGCDLCILLVAFRRGYIPEGETRSITQMEYDYAMKIGVDVLPFALEEDAPWSRKFDELDKDPGIREWREQLFRRHGVKTFGTKPDSVDVGPALSRWIIERQSSPATRTALQGIEALTAVLHSDPEARDEVVRFSSDFEAVAAQISRISDYKWVHELLHQLHFEIYRPLIMTISALASGSVEEDFVMEGLTANEARFHQLVEQLDEAAGRDTFKTRQLNWLQHLYEARRELAAGIDDVSPAKLRQVIGRIKQVLDRELSRIDVGLTDLAAELRMDRLAKAMSAIHLRISPQYPDEPRIQQFAEGAKALTELNTSLQHLIRTHSAWQDFDDQLRLIEGMSKDGRVDLIELGNSWPILQRIETQLDPSLHDDERHDFRRYASNLNEGLAAGDVAQTRRAFGRYRGFAGTKFYRIDQQLLELCDELQKVGGPLDSMLQELR